MNKDIIKMSNRPRLTIIKAPTGIGKSHAYIKYALANDKCSKVVVAPTNDLKDQIFNDCVEKYGYSNFMKTPLIPKFKVEEIQERIENLHIMGLHSAVKRYLGKKKIELKKKNNKTAEEKEDLESIEYYLEQNKLVNNFEGNVITTHDRLFYFTDKFFSKHKIIIDEDIIKKSLKITKISMGDIASFNSKDFEVFNVMQDRIMQIANADYQKTVQLKYNDIKENAIIKEVKDEAYDFDIMAFLKAKAFLKYNPQKEKMENFIHLRENGDIKGFLPNSTDEIYFLEIRDLPKYDTILFSASSNKSFYTNLFWAFDVEEIDIGEVKLKGKIKQYPASSCSRYDLEIHPSKIRGIIKKYPKIDKEQIITFLRYKESDKALNFGNTEGKNLLEGKDLLIIGTPHCNESVYKLYAFALSNFQDDFSDEKMRYQEIEYNGCKFWFNTYDNRFLRNIQLWFINTELEQAVGRARLLRNDCTVYLYSNLPMRQAEFCYSDEE